MFLAFNQNWQQDKNCNNNYGNRGGNRYNNQGGRVEHGMLICLIVLHLSLLISSKTRFKEYILTFI